MRKQIGVFGVNEEVLRLAQLLETNPNIEIVRYWAADKDAALEDAYLVGAEIAGHLKPLLTDDLNAFLSPGDLDAVVDSGGSPSFASVFPDAADGELQILKPLTARLLWAYGVVNQDRKAELLQALGEIVESVDLAIDSDELFLRMLDIAVGSTGADGGSLMLLDESRQELRIRVAHGIERELWPKIRVRLGEGIAGRVAADARSLLLHGKADADKFEIVRERADVESAICLPLIVSGRVLGVLNLHHSAIADSFDEDDLHFLEQLAALDAQIIDRAQERETLRDQAARFSAVREVQKILGVRAPILERLEDLCRLFAEHVGGGIATVYLSEERSPNLSLAATSLTGGGFAGEYQIVNGQGIDGRVAQTGRAAYLRGDDDAVAYVCLPLCAGEESVGILTLQVGSKPPRGRAAEEILREMAAAMSEGIARADREARMAVRATRANAINEAGVRMVSVDDVNEVARMATSSSAMIMEAEHAVLRLQDPQTLRYVIRAYFGPADGRQQERLFRFDKQVSVETIRRRTPIIVQDITHSTKSPEATADVRSLLSAPLKRDGRVVGILSVYDKVAPDRFYALDFNDDDLASFSRFVTYVERAVENAQFHSFARQHRNFDPQTSLPNAAYLGKRIQEEVVRAGGRQCALAIATCEIENLAEIEDAASASQVHRVILGVAETLRGKVRDFDVLGRTATSRFTILLPDPGPAPDQRVAELARTVADEISKIEKLNDPVRIALAFGYAVYPGDGSNRKALLEAAETARIRML
jgi:diguanylate cyclase (GGDEF)-like protein